MAFLRPVLENAFPLNDGNGNEAQAEGQDSKDIEVDNNRKRTSEGEQLVIQASTERKES